MRTQLVRGAAVTISEIDGRVLPALSKGNVMATMQVGSVPAQSSFFCRGKPRYGAASHTRGPTGTSR